MKKQILDAFWKGVVTLLPLLGTFYIIYVVLSWLENLFSNFLKYWVSDSFLFPGIGIVTAIVVMMGTGFLVQIWLPGKIFNLVETLLERVPVVKSIYGSLRDFSDLLSKSDKSDKLKKVVRVKIDGLNGDVLGFVTTDKMGSVLKDDIDEVVVYIPMSYQIGGFMIIVNRKDVQEVDCSFEDAMQMILTAGVSKK